MKNARKIIVVLTYRTLAALLIGSVFLMGCQKEEDNGPKPTKNIVQAATENPEFSTLIAALNKTGLDATLSSSSNITVFAPTNAAFAGLPAPFTDAASISAITDAGQIEQLRTILLYHVVEKKMNQADFASGNSTLLTFTGKELARISVLKTADGLYLNGNAKVVVADIQASNGVIHGIDRVLLLP